MPSLLRAASFFALALGTFVAGCDDDETDPVYLGVVDGSALPESAAPDASPDAAEIGNLAVSTCDNQPAIQGPDVASVVRFAAAGPQDLSKLVLTVHDGINAYEMDANACPGQPVAGFGTAGHVAIDAVAAVPFGTNTLVATPDRTLVLNQAGAEEATCLDKGADVRVRWLASNADTTLGVFVRPPVASFSHENGPCVVSWVEFQDSPAVLLALTAGTNGAGVVVAEQPTASSSITVSRYQDGKRTTSGLNLAGAPVLCSVTGLIDTPQGILVADAACKQIVLYDGASLQPIKQALLDGAPRGLAWPGGTKVLVPVARPTANGAEAVFQVADIAN